MPVPQTVPQTHTALRLPPGDKGVLPLQNVEELERVLKATRGELRSLLARTGALGGAGSGASSAAGAIHGEEPPFGRSCEVYSLIFQDISGHLVGSSMIFETLSVCFGLRRGSPEGLRA